MTTLSQLIERASTVIRDSDGLFITPNDMVQWCNEAITDIAARTETYEVTETGAIPLEETLPIPGTTTPELIAEFSIVLGTNDRVEFVDSDTFDLWVDATTTPTPTIGRVNGDNFEFYPVPDAGTDYELRYKGLPLPLASSGDVFPLASIFERKVIAYMRYQAKMKDGDTNLASGYLGEYEQGLPAVRSGRVRANPGPMTLTVEPNTFDSNPDATHLGPVR